jgi:lipoprotein NlpD
MVMTEARIKKTSFNCLSFFTVAMLMLGCSNRDTPAPVANSYGSIPLKDRVKKNISSSYYTVKKGETLYSISWRANSDVRSIAKLNKLSTPYEIFPGQKLIVSNKNSHNISQPIASNSFTKLSDKGGRNNIQKSDKKIVAPNKKQEYGKNVSDIKVSKKITSEGSTFSKKVREWQWPANGKVIDKFSTAQQGNKGINIAGRRGDKVRAAAKGKVVYAGNALRGYGQLVIVKHNDDYLSAYAHNDKILVKEKQQVNAGDVIAKMGDTGEQKVMLHFEVRFRGKSVNPMKYLPKQ